MITAEGLRVEQPEVFGTQHRVPGVALLVPVLQESKPPKSTQEKTHLWRIGLSRPARLRFVHSIPQKWVLTLLFSAMPVANPTG